MYQPHAQQLMQQNSSLNRQVQVVAVDKAIDAGLWAAFASALILPHLSLFQISSSPLVSMASRRPCSSCFSRAVTPVRAASP